MIEARRRQVLFETVLAELAANGYERISIAAALEASGVSAAEFEAEFSGTDECLFAAYEELGERALALARSECEGPGSWPQKVGGGLALLLDAVAERPELARVVTRGVPAIRPSAYRRYTELISKFAPLVSGGREYSGMSAELPAEVELLAVGAAESLIFAEVDAGRAERLPRMLPEILFSVLVPFLGPDRAGEEMRSAAAVR